MGNERDIVENGFEQDRLDYWAMRDELLAKYAGSGCRYTKAES
jgi:hypothetical protein